jgi:hypothetical protein
MARTAGTGSSSGRSSMGGLGAEKQQRHACSRQPERLDRRKARTRQALIDAAVRLIAEAILRMFGVPATDASRIAALDLPSFEAW